MANAKHSEQTISDGIHIAYAFEYADQSAREGASGFTSADVGKFARQLDNNSIWMLTATTPTWVRISDSGSGGGGGSGSLFDTLDTGNTTDGYNIDLTGGSALVSSDGNVTVDDNLDVFGDGYFSGKLTVVGLIDPTGLVLDNQVSIPGGTPGAGKTTLWVRDTDGYLMVSNDESDEPVATQTYVTTNAVSDHGNLIGLNDDDHTQYLLVSGSRAMTGDLDMGTNAITNVGNIDGVDVSSHASRHENGGADEISVAGLSGQLADPQTVTVRRNSGADIGTQPRLNFIEGSNISLSISNDSGNNEVDITITSTGGGGGGGGTQTLSTTLGLGNTTDGYDIAISSGDALNTEGDTDLLIERNSVSVFTFGNTTTDAHSRRIVNILDPTNDQDAATKAYVDANAGAGGQETLSETLAFGNTTDGYDIELSSGDTLNTSADHDLLLERNSTSVMSFGTSDTNVHSRKLINVTDPDDPQDAATRNYIDTNFTTDHGSLGGLADDDHTQYLLVSGSRAMTGSLDMGSNAITNVGNVDGVDVSAHSARHENGGADEINVGGLSGTLADPQTITVRQDSGSDIGTRSRLNFIEGSNVTLSISDDAGNDEVDITINATDNDSSQTLSETLDQGNATDGYDIELSSGDSLNTSDDHDLLIERNSVSVFTFGNTTTNAHSRRIINVTDPTNPQDAATKNYIDTNFTTDHGSLAGLADDDHTQYALLAGRTGGQTLIGGSDSGEDLTLQSTSDATRGTIIFADDIDVGGNAITNVGNVDGVDVSNHSARHENGGADEISVAGLSGQLADPQTITVRRNTGADIGTRSRLNFIEGANISLSISDDAGNDEVDITITATGGDGGGGGSQTLSTTLGLGNTTDGYDLLISSGDALGSAGDSDLLIERNSVSVFTFGSSDTNVHSRKLINVTDPTSDQDAATKKYVDDNAGGQESLTETLGYGNITDGYDIELSSGDSLNTSADHDLLLERNSVSVMTFGSTTTNAHSRKIINVTDPDDPQDAATKNYIDTNFTTDHGSLTGLGDDDHTQYLLVSGSRAMAGDLDMGTNAITNVGNIDGVDVSAHSARHENGGADEISVEGLSGTLADPQTITVRQNTGADIGNQSRLNFIEGTNISLSISEDVGNSEIDITINSTDTTGEETLSETLAFGNTTDGYNILLSSGDTLGTSADHDLLLERNSVSVFTFGSTTTNVHSRRLINVIDPTNDQDAATKTYVDTQINNVVSGGEDLTETLANGNTTDGYDIELSSGDALNTSADHDLLLERNSVSVFTFGSTTTDAHSRKIINVTDPDDPQDAATKNYIDTNFTADHGELSGLGDDDHTQYLLVSGSRAMTGSLDMGTNAITNVGNIDGVDVSSHASRHENGGADEISVAGLSGQLADPQIVTVRQNTGADVGSQPRLNFIEGSNVTLSISEDGANNEIDITINATDNDSSQTLSQTLDQGNTTDGYDILLSSGDALNTSADHDLLIERNSSSVMTFGTSDTNIHSRKLINVTDPDNPQDAATKNYIDTNFTADHGGLTGLGDDDHTQYLLVSGSRAMTGDLDMGTNAITNVGNVDGVDISNHSARHENGGADEISVAGLSGQLADPQTITVRQNTGADIGTRPRLNFIEGSNVTLSISDDAGDDEIDITINATDNDSSQTLSQTLNEGNTTDGYDILMSAGDAVNTNGDTDLLIERNSVSVFTFGSTTTSAHSRRIINVTDPTDPQDAATRNYVDTNFTADHGELSGLADDDHTQYLLVSGSRAMTGDLDMGTNAITNVGNVDGVDISAHAARHENGGADEISVAGLSGTLADPQTITVRQNTGADIGTRSRLNFIEGSNISLSISDDAGSDEVDITITSTSGGGSQTLSQTLDQGNTTDGYDILLSSGDALGTDGDIDLLIERNSVSYITLDGYGADFNDVELNNIKASTYAIVHSNGNSGSAQTITWTESNIQTVTLTDNVTFTFTAPRGPTSVTLFLVQDGTGGRTATWPGSVLWPNSTDPELTTDANAVDIVTFIYDGTNYYGSFSPNY